MSVRLTDEEINKYLNEITSGRRTVVVKNNNKLNIVVTLRHPSPEEEIEGNYLYESTFEQCISRNILIQEDLKNIIADESNKAITNIEKTRIANLKSKIETLKISLKKTITYKDLVNKRKQLEQYQSQLFHLEYNYNYKFYEYSAENISNKKRNAYYILCCTEKHLNPGIPLWNTREEFDQTSSPQLINEIIKEFIQFNNGFDHGTLRCIARSQKTKTMWAVSVKTGAPMFGIPMHGGQNFYSAPISRWTKNQLALVSWLNYYQNIAESGEPPPEYIYDDDEKFDKYVHDLIRRKEIDRIKNLSKSSGGKGKSPRASNPRNHQDLIVLGPEKDSLLGI